MKRFKAWLIKLLGGEKKIFVPHRVVEYNGLGRPFETSDWERLATMQVREPEYFRYLAHQLQQLDESDRALPLGAEHDRTRLANNLRRSYLNDSLKLSDIAAARVTDARNKAEPKARDKGLNNHGT